MEEDILNYLYQLSCFVGHPVQRRMQSKHKQTNYKQSRPKSYTDYSFPRGYHYTKSKNYFKRRYQIRH